MAQVFGSAEATNIVGAMDGQPRLVLKIQLTGDDAEHAKTLLEIRELHANGPPPTAEDNAIQNLRDTCSDTLEQLGASSQQDR